jgi:hypothetical protein
MPKISYYDGSAWQDIPGVQGATGNFVGDASTITTGAVPIANGGTGATTGLTVLNGSSISTGTVPIARGGTGATAATGTSNNVLSSYPLIDSPVFFTTTSSPFSTNVTSTLVASDMINGILVSTSVTAITMTAAAGSSIDTQLTTSLANTSFLSSGSVGLSFDFSIIASAGAVTLASGTSNTIVGTTVVAANTSGRYRARKTGTSAYTFYRV